MRRFCFIFIVLLALSSCAPKAPSGLKQQAKLNQMTPNIAYVLAPYDQAWQTTLDIIKYEFLLPIEIQNKDKGFFSTVMVKDYTETAPRRYRVSGDLSSNNHETMIKLYKSEQIKLPDGTWKTRLSNLALEMNMVNKIQAKLKQP